MMLSVQEEKVSREKEREKEGTQEEERIFSLMRKGEKLADHSGCVPWHSSMETNSEWVESFLGGEEDHMAHFGHRASQTCQRHLCPNEGMILARPQQRLVTMDEPGLRGKGIPFYPWSYNIYNLCAFWKKRKLSRLGIWSCI